MFVQALWVLGSLLTTFAIAIDGARYLLQRHQIYHALQETIRLQSRDHMHPERFATQLKQLLKQVYVPQPLGWPHSWHAEQHSPNDDDFIYFRDPLLEQAYPWSYPMINNLYLKAQHQNTALKNGLIHSQSGPKPITAAKENPTKNIFAANTLVLVFYYSFQPLNPVVRAIVKSLAQQANHPYSRQLLAQGLMPLIFEIQHPYASHPIAWPQHPNLPYYRLQSTHPKTLLGATAGYFFAPSANHNSQPISPGKAQLPSLIKQPINPPQGQMGQQSEHPLLGQDSSSYAPWTEVCDHPGCSLSCL